MREIKIRAWDKVAKQWLWVTGIETAETSKSDGYTLEGIFHDGDFVGHEDIIVTQCTGLKDKNEKDIYEGDILSDEDYSNVKGKVYFENGFFKTDLWNMDTLYEDLQDLNLEVIGNIFENPELLEDAGN